ncbi:LGFP repeat-containing protein [Modestobacter sp. URMC 112]
MSPLARRLPGAAALVLALLALATLVVAPPAAGPAEVRLAPAADTSRFDPGNIISDEVFFDGRSMTAPEVQAFLDSKAPTCRPGADGTPCIKAYRQDTPSMPATAFCGFYPGGWQESAADIIAKVGWSCGVNPRVLMVLLQKEQSLITNTGSSLYRDRYLKATGFGCPDTAPCDPAYGGFFYQVYNAARQFQNYRVNASRFGYRAGIVNQVRFHPNTACGASGVYLANQATAGLYNYTPYQPNAAALRAGYGEGDGCSAYGNRNFWLYYTDWFGTTQHPGGGQVATKYAQYGGATGSLGGATSLITCGLRDGGCFQDYRNGAIHWSPATGARVTAGWIASRWTGDSRENGSLGYPVTDEMPAAGGGAWQVFQRGTIFSSPVTGAHKVVGWVYDRWTVHRRELGVLGYPTGEERPVAGGGVAQTFQKGVIYSSPSTGAREVHGWILDRWTQLGREAGMMGFPTSDEIATPAGAYSTFTGGTIYWTPQAGAREVHGWINIRWAALGGARSFVGFPVADERPAGDGVGAFSEFSNGLIYYSPATGAHDIVGPAAAKWRAMGGVRSFLGYPTADARPLPGGGWLNSFQGGSILFSATSGAFEVHGWIGDLWARKSGALGYPTSDEQRAPDGVGVFQTFQGGVVYSSPATGAHEVHGSIGQKWAALGGFSFPGAPVTDELTMPDGVGKANVFSSGAAIYFTPGTGAWEVHGWVRDLYSSLNGEQSFLGYPVSDETPLPGGGVLARFQGGHIYSSGATGAREVHGAILTRYLELGGPSSSLGLPVSNEYSVSGGRRSDFQGGSITVDTRTWAITVTGR